MTIDALERLAASNPVPPGERQWVAMQLDLDELARRPTSRRTRARRTALAAAVLALLAAAVLLVAPALGVGIPGLDFFQAEKAPPEIVKSFAELSEGAPPGMNPNVIPGETRKVTTVRFASGKEHTLWVAPTQAGGLCFEWTDADGGCDAAGAVPLSVSWMAPKVFDPPKFRARDFQRVTGFAHSKWVGSVEIHLSDGTTVEPSIIWVSAPISAGFFVYEPPPGVFINSVVGLRDGEAVAGDMLGTGDLIGPVPSPFADLSRKTALATIETPAGRATAWSAPTKTEETCRWLELAGKTEQLTPCLPPAYDGQGLPAVVMQVGNVKLLGFYAPQYRTVELRFGNGQTVRIDPQNGVGLYAIRRADASLFMRAEGKNGKAMLTLPVSLAPTR